VLCAANVQKFPQHPTDNTLFCVGWWNVCNLQNAVTYPDVHSCEIPFVKLFYCSIHLIMSAASYGKRAREMTDLGPTRQGHAPSAASEKGRSLNLRG
jgi:hypothetical protein